MDVDSSHKNGIIAGLTADEVIARRQQSGENILPTVKGPSGWMIFFSQFKSPLVYIILIAAGISLLVGELGDFGIIMAVVIIDAILGFIQEYQAQKTYTALRGLLKPTTTVIRDGKRQEIDIRELVPDDIVVLNAGEHIPGDGTVLESTKLSVDEAILTGESEPINKSTDAGHSLVFTGSTVVTGRGLMQVTHTGSNTELGQIAASLQGSETEETPLQVRLRGFSKVLTLLVLGMTLVIFTVGLITGKGFFSMLRISIILAIAAVPEGLLIAVTVILVLGMRKILKRNGLVKKLLAVETLGSVTVICTDKTGTITEGRMRVTRLDINDSQHALETMILCNDLEGPVDIALWEYASTQLSEGLQEVVDNSPRLAEEMFTSETKFMITRNQGGAERLNYLKGAPEIVLDMCDMNIEKRNRILTRVEDWAGEGLRLIGLAYRPDRVLEDHSGYIWIGLVAMEDPIREGVLKSISAAKQAGIKVKMITGDYRRTAERIAHNIGLLTDDGESHANEKTIENRQVVDNGKVIEGEELSKLSDQQLLDQVDQIVIFSRIHPKDKLRIVRALQARGEITAMIGDGVNDAPALQRANIGVVVGDATDVAKETADLILLDNNFRTVVAAIEEGRVIFENIRKVVAYTLSNSFAEVLTIFVAMILGWPTPLLVAQILWVHLICDGPSDIVLGFEPKEEGIMDEKPKSLKEPVLTPLGLSLIGVISFSSAIVALLLFGHYYFIHSSEIEGRSFAFASFAVNSMVYIFAYRSMRHSIFRSGPLSQNKPLVVAVLSGLFMAVGAFLVPAIRDLLQIEPLSWMQWMLIFGVACGLLLVVETGKWIATHGYSRKKTQINLG
jgi:Ca2+-transporting ATPase